MIQYEFEDDNDHTLFQQELNLQSHEMPEASWANPETFQSDFFPTENLSLDQYYTDSFTSYGQNDFSGLNIENFDYPQEYVEPKVVNLPPINPPAQPPPAQSPIEYLDVEERSEPVVKRKLKRRPIDEFRTNNGFKKPNFSYCALIGMTLRNAEDGELAVSEIYRFLCHHFPFFREAPSGWKNSIRHNLSLNQCFEKVDFDVGDVQSRKAFLWRLNPEKDDKIDAEIRKWKERSATTIASAMINPGDLDAIIEGRMGMPPAHFQYSDTPSEERPKRRRVEPKVIVVRTDIAPSMQPPHRYVGVGAGYQQYPKAGTSGYQAERTKIGEKYHHDSNASVPEDPIPPFRYQPQHPVMAPRPAPPRARYLVPKRISPSYIIRQTEARPQKTVVIKKPRPFPLTYENRPVEMESPPMNFLDESESPTKENSEVPQQILMDNVEENGSVGRTRIADELDKLIDEVVTNRG
ncbi:unnamed protein product [Bursaphelenchus xylophilus]|uniref:(pine wood nematode) hypothetical protein n=1 Tax=Bursaphelenchus xylophilus TaxID=6326 RepID=A0A1I7RMB0_BURXY|nr:unnamed protein product [Bursaphelenchus xylophilus]CAG9118344.1 unnamed protein product [Bursaphelenchus xylophilus]